MFSLEVLYAIIPILRVIVVTGVFYFDFFRACLVSVRVCVPYELSNCRVPHNSDQAGGGGEATPG